MKQKEENKTKVSREGLRRMMGLFRYVLPYKLSFMLGMFFMVFSSLTALSFPYIVGLLLDSAVPGQGMLEGKVSLPKMSPSFDLSVNQVGLIFLVMLILQGVFSFFRILTFAHFSEKAMGDIRKDMYKKMIGLPITFFEQNRVGELTSRLTADVTQLQEVLSWSLAEFFRQVITIIVGGIIIFFLSPKLGLLMLLTFPILVLLGAFFGRKIRGLSKASQAALAEANVTAEEGLQNIQVVKSFTNEWLEHNRYVSGIDRVVKLAIRTATFRGMLVTFIITGVIGALILVLWQGAVMLKNNTIDVGELTSFILYTLFIGGSLGGIGEIYSRIQKAVGATERLQDIMDMDSEIDVKPNLTGQQLNGSIEFEGVSFSYPTRKDIQVLDNLSFQVKPGEKIALVGPSGAGKSTVAQLLLAMYPRNEGKIKIDDKELSNYEINYLRQHIGLVPQEVILFGGTIKENIAYGKPGASDASINDAANKANALEFIKGFPEGMDTVVGERGIKLSGGQRQRIAIARAILKDPAILILDEATSSLDSESEKLVQQALDLLMEGRSSIIIAHRLSTIRAVDKILVLDKGILIESGTHEELSKLPNGMYKHLLDLQNDGYLSEAALN